MGLPRRSTLPTQLIRQHRTQCRKSWNQLIDDLEPLTAFEKSIIFNGPTGIRQFKSYTPIIEQDRIIGYFEQVSGVKKIGDREGKIVWMDEKGLESSWISPIDFVGPGVLKAGAKGVGAAAIAIKVGGSAAARGAGHAARQAVIAMGRAIVHLRTVAARLLAQKGSQTAGSIASKIALKQAGKFATGRGKITLFHGMGQGAKQGFRASRRLRFSPPKEDFGAGIYTTPDPRVANAFLQSRGGAGVLRAEVDLSRLGKVVDVRVGGAHHKLWTQYLDKPLEHGGVSLNTTVRQLVERDAGLRGEYFLKFLKEAGLEEADVIVGPIGTPLTAGTVKFVSEQVVIRSQSAAKVISELFYHSL